MNKNFSTIFGLASVLLLTMCSSAVIAKERNYNITPSQITIQAPEKTANLLHPEEKPITVLEQKAINYKKAQERERLKNKELQQNLSDLTVAVENTKKYAGKTWYVFSGSTPQGWDCSGLVLWTYSHMGFDLYHSATAQMNSGYEVGEPKYGDIVGFKYHGASRFYHVGIYVSEDLMLHSGGKRGDKTELRSISNFAGDHSRVIYSRLVDTK